MSVDSSVDLASNNVENLSNATNSDGDVENLDIFANALSTEISEQSAINSQVSATSTSPDLIASNTGDAIGDAISVATQQLGGIIQAIPNILQNSPPDVDVFGSVIDLPVLGKIGLFVLQPSLPNAPLIPDFSKQPIIFFAIPSRNVVGTYNFGNGQIEFGPGATKLVAPGTVFFYNQRTGGTTSGSQGSASVNLGFINSTVSDPLIDAGIDILSRGITGLARALQGAGLLGDAASVPSGEGVAAAIAIEGFRIAAVRAIQNRTTWFAGVGWRAADLIQYRNGERIINLSGSRLRINQGQGPGGSGLSSSQFAFDATRYAGGLGQFDSSILPTNNPAAQALGRILYNSYLEGGKTAEEAATFTAGAFQNGGRTLLARRALEVLYHNVPNSVTDLAFIRMGMPDTIAGLAKSVYDSARQNGYGVRESWMLTWSYYILGHRNVIETGVKDFGYAGGANALRALAFDLQSQGSLQSDPGILVASADLNGILPAAASAPVEQNPAFANIPDALKSLIPDDDGDDLILASNPNYNYVGSPDAVDTVAFLDASSGVELDLTLRTDVYDFLGIDAIAGSDQGDTLTGDAGDNTFLGADGGDTISGGLGADTIYGDYSDPFVENYGPQLGLDPENLPGGNDILDGGDGDDVIVGGKGDDTITGGAGNDRIVWTEGNDTINGGDGEDTVVFKDIGRGNALVVEAGDVKTVTLDDGTVLTLTGVENLVFEELTVIEDAAFRPLGTEDLPANDDGSSNFIDLSDVFEGGLKIGNETFSGMYVNNNGNITFRSSLGTYTPESLFGLGQPIIAPFWADIDTRGAGTVTWDINKERDSVIITWNDAGYYNNAADKRNSIQLELVDRGDQNFEVIFRYNDVNWTAGSASGGSGGLGGVPARAGISNGSSQTVELPQSGSESQMLNLENTAGNTGVTGVWQFLVEDGEIVDPSDPETNQAPQVSIAAQVSTLDSSETPSQRILVGNVTISDDNKGTNILSLSGGDADKFELIGNELYLKEGVLLDSILDGELNVTVNVNDPELGVEAQSSAEFSIKINLPPETPTLELVNTVEVIAVGTPADAPIPVATLNLANLAGQGAVTLAGPDAGLFEISGNQLFLKAGADLTAERVLNVSVQLDDSGIAGAADAEASLEINVKQNTIATNIQLLDYLQTLTPDTDTTAPVKIADIAIVDDGLGTNTLSLQGADAGRFTIVGNTLYLNAGEDLSNVALGDLDLQVVISDPSAAGAATTVIGIPINISQNAAPSAVTLQPATLELPESLSTLERIKVADIVVDDDNLGNNVLALTGADAGSFEIIGTELFLKAGTPLDFETKNRFDVSITVDDPSTGATPDALADFVLTVGDENEPVQSVSLVPASGPLSEDAPTAAAIKVADIVISDDGIGTNNLSLAGADASKFEIVGNELYLRAGATLDFETNPSLDVTVNVDDPTLGGFVDASANFALPIIDTNEAPAAVTILNPVSNVLLGSTLTAPLKVGDIAVADDALGTNSLSLSGPDAGLFSIAGTELFLNPGIDLATARTLQVTVSVDDPAVGATPDASANFAVNVAANAAPSGVTLSNFLSQLLPNADTSQPIRVADVIISDDGLGTNSLALSGRNADLFEISGNQVFLKAGTDLTGLTDLNVDITVDDPTAGGAPDAQVNLAINIVQNRPPVGISLTRAVAQIPQSDQPSVATRVADLSVSDDGLGTNEFSLSGTDADKFEIIGNQLYLRAGVSITDPATLSVTISVDDVSVGNTPDATRTFSLRVQNNAAPTQVSLLNPTTQLEETAGAALPTRIGDIVVTDDALGANALSLSGADADSFILQGNVLYLKPGVALDYETKSFYDVRIEASDTGLPGSLPAFFDYRLNVIDTPAVRFDNAVTSLLEGVNPAAVRLADIVRLDIPASAALTLSGADADKFEIIGDSLFLKAGAVLDFETQSILNVEIRSSDPADTSVVNFQLSVEDLNLLNVVNQPYEALGVNENIDTTNGVLVGDIVLDGPQSNFNLTLTGPDADRFQIIGNQLFIRPGAVIDYETEPVAGYGEQPGLDVTVEADDLSTPQVGDASQAVRIAINDVNDDLGLDIANALASLAETADTSQPVKIADLAAVNDTNGNAAYSLTGADADKFEIVGTELFLKAGTALDFETQPQLGVTVNLDDPFTSASPDISRNILVQITDVDETPVSDPLNLGSSVANGLIQTNQYLTSPNGQYFAIFQGDGNFVVYQGQPDNVGPALWNSGTQGQAAGGFVALQADGNLVVYNASGGAPWFSNTQGAGVNRGFSLVMQDDGNLVVYDSQGGEPLWSSQTGRLAGAEPNAPAAPLDLGADSQALAYIASYPDLIQAANLLADRSPGALAAWARSHYAQYGQNEGRAISFNPVSYGLANPDVWLAFAGDPAQMANHYLIFGAGENRVTAIASGPDLTGEGSALAYIASYPDLIAASASIASPAEAAQWARSHFVSYGRTEGRVIGFDPAVYGQLNPDVFQAYGGDPAQMAFHYLRFGYNEGRRIA